MRPRGKILLYTPFTITHFVHIGGGLPHTEEGNVYNIHDKSGFLKVDYFRSINSF